MHEKSYFADRVFGKSPGADHGGDDVLEEASAFRKSANGWLQKIDELLEAQPRFADNISQEDTDVTYLSPRDWEHDAQEVPISTPQEKGFRSDGLKPTIVDYSYSVKRGEEQINLADGYL